MATITPSVAPGSYLDHQTIKFNFSAGVMETALTKGNIPPSISKYIAYDTLSPPNPFIAVTQDGRGNVVYDGGFPKFYNGTVPTPTPTTFAAMPAGHKFLYNAVNWVANASKVASGNKKVLILGDKDNSNGGDGYITSRALQQCDQTALSPRLITSWACLAIRQRTRLLRIMA